MLYGVCINVAADRKYIREPYGERYKHRLREIEMKNAPEPCTCTSMPITFQHQAKTMTTVTEVVRLR